MSEIIVRLLGEGDWQPYRDIRLAALLDAPDAFVATRSEEAVFDEQAWRARMLRSRRMLAECDGSPVGVVSLGHGGPDQTGGAELFGLWVAPAGRGAGVAWKLVEAGAGQALADGHSHVGYWVGTDNGRAVAFASGFGFRPTAQRRPMRVVSEDDGEEELAMTLPLSGDRGGIAQF